MGIKWDGHLDGESLIVKNNENCRERKLSHRLGLIFSKINNLPSNEMQSITLGVSLIDLLVL